jgi:hypothetical protein
MLQKSSGSFCFHKLIMVRKPVVTNRIAGKFTNRCPSTLKAWGTVTLGA